MMKQIKIVVKGQPRSGKSMVSALIKHILSQYYANVKVKSINKYSIDHGTIYPKKVDPYMAEITILDNDQQGCD